MRVLLLALMLPLAGCVSPAEADPHAGHGGPAPGTLFERGVEGLPTSRPTEVRAVAPGGTIALSAGLVAHDPGTGVPIRMFAYDAMVPGPTIRAPAGSTFYVDFRNDLPFPTTVHWHGLRLDPRFDGVPGLSQAPVPPGGQFRYEVRAPDEGVFWYHAHVREDVQQDLGLYGTLLVDGPRAAPGPAEHVLVLDDLLLAGDDVAPYGTGGASHVLMGRYGNWTMVNGGTAFATEGRPGERLRLHLLDVANVRPFLLAFEGATKTELVAFDGGYLAAPRTVDTVLLSPGERATVDVVLPSEGEVHILHRPPGLDETLLGRIPVAGEPAADPGAPPEPHARAREDLAAVLAHEPRVDVDWVLDMRLLDTSLGLAGGHHHHGTGPTPIEWEDGMLAVNERSNTGNLAWIVRDPWTLTENMEIDLAFDEGTYVDIRIDNKAKSLHPMQHPIHLHGQRFVLRSIDGVRVDDPVWRDTVLVPTGVEVVITVEMSNPGTWMFHCHIAEHMESGMMGTFTVA